MRTAEGCLCQMRSCIAMLIMLAVGPLSAAISPVDCGSDDIPHDLLHDLYDYSLIAEYAFRPKNDPPEASCVVAEQKHDFTAPWESYSLVPLSSRTLSPDAVRNYLEGIEEPAVAYVVKDKGGNIVDDHYHLSCFDKQVIPQLAVRLFQYNGVAPRSTTISSTAILVGGDRENGSGQKPSILEKVRHAIYTVFEVSFILPRSVIEELVNLVPEDHRSHIRTILEGEGLENAHLHRIATAPSVNQNDQHHEDIYLIRGTQFLDPAQVLQQIRASLNYSMNETCVFRVAALVAGNISMNYREDSDSFIAVGHSLGGAVAQYIAKDYSTNPDSYSYAADFMAFSYNSVGLKEPPVEPLRTLNSFCIDKDFACSMGSTVHHQAGTAITYFPSNGGDKFSNHTIRQVQKSLCKCKVGEGQLGIVRSQEAVVAHSARSDN